MFWKGQRDWCHRVPQGAVAVLFLAGLPLMAHARRPQFIGSDQRPAPIERRAPASRPGAQAGAGLHRGPRGEHLAEWMNQHSALSAPQQQQALEREPGFRELPPDTQQRMRNRLAQLDAMTPQQRQRVLARTEAMERLSPDQRAQVRGAMSQLGALPMDERRSVAKTFRSLRELPPEQRLAAADSGRYGPPLNEQQRGVLMNLLRVEPLMGNMLMGQQHPETQAPSAMGLH